MRMLISLFILFGMFPTTIASAQIEDSTSVLSGLSQVTVSIAKLSLEDETEDSVIQEIRNDVIVKLSAAGLLVEDTPTSECFPELESQEQSVRLGGLTVSEVGVALTQYVTVLRKPRSDLLKRVVTWEKSLFGIYGTGNFPEQLRKKVNQLIDSFVDEYSQANPGSDSNKGASIIERLKTLETMGYRPLEILCAGTKERELNNFLI